MLFCEFQEGTGCKDNEHNHKVYKELEIIYMNTDCTKEHIYEMGKKLVDNSKSEEQVRFENEIKEQIQSYKNKIADNKQEIEWFEELAKIDELYGDMEGKKHHKNMAKWYKEENKFNRQKIRELKWVLS